jgi:hypothetical protein
MDERRLIKSRLDCLSSNELIKLADNYGIDIPPGLERVFIIEELLDVVVEDSEPAEREEQPAFSVNFPETAELPKQYNITFIEVLIRDPLWAFVFWEVKGHDKDFYEKAPDFGGYCLRVIPLEGKPAKQKENSFTVPVGINDTAWYLGFPPAEGRYQVEMCALREHENIVLAVSRPFMLPRLLNRPTVKTGADPLDMQEVYRNSLARLSGAEEFPVIRSADRLSRILGNGGYFQAG